MKMQGAIGRSDIVDAFSMKYPICGGFKEASVARSCSTARPCRSFMVSRRFSTAGLIGMKNSGFKGLFESNAKNPGGAFKIRAQIEDSDSAVTPAEKAEARSSFLSRSQTHTLLKQQMRVAALNEDYKEAARIRDTLKVMEDQEPALRLQNLLKQAISEERFEDAAKYRNELQLIAPDALLKCFSDTTTLGIRIQVRSVYVKGRSQPSKGQYFFAYRIRISNGSNRPVQLVRRHWAITDATGKTEHIWGIGVIGEQPVLLPGTSFEYSSACPVGTATGKMEGDFGMKYVDKVRSDLFNVLIGPFALSVDGDEDSI